MKRYDNFVVKINEFEPMISAMSDELLQNQTPLLRQKLQDGTSLDEILPEAFATVREASKRVLGLRHFDVQLIGGAVLHDGKIAEMKTGEGKTLVSTLTAYVNALPGQGVHIVTANEYLASRDCALMGRLFSFLGLSVGLNIHGLNREEKRAAYACDITYGTSSEFGFDYLRDNMVLYSEDWLQRPLQFAIIDEVDSILIDEARTPLIISGQGTKSSELYITSSRFVKSLKHDEDYTIDIKQKSIALTDVGVQKAERMFGVDNLFDPTHTTINHAVSKGLKAHYVLKRDVDYMVNQGQIIIIDEFTGRPMEGRRYSEGLHQAIEAKEGLQVRNENVTLATVTVQNYFRMYRKLSGMTGTAKTEEQEFSEIYGMSVITIPTHRTMIRTDKNDMIFANENAKFQAIVNEISRIHKTGAPVLVGTISIERSELLSNLLKRIGVKHQVLNAKHHAKEAEIISQAGQKNMVTIATNMAGRGTDILLGEGVTELGGLHIIGTERHDSRRIDNQLRGRAGRQGDPGSSQFYISMEDEMIRRFGGDRIQSMMEKLHYDENEPITNAIATKTMERAQKQVEAVNFEQRKHVLKFDNVINQQRDIIYKQRREVIESSDVESIVSSMMNNVSLKMIESFCSESTIEEEWDLISLSDSLNGLFGKKAVFKRDDFKMKDFNTIITFVQETIGSRYQIKRQLFIENINELEKMIVLQVVDAHWMDHIDAMDQLRDGIHLRAYAQKDPLQEYQFEGFEMFQTMIDTIEEEISTQLLSVEKISTVDRKEIAVETSTSSGNDEPKKPIKREEKIGRNAPCPCGSGKKYKQCHGK